MLQTILNALSKEAPSFSDIQLHSAFQPIISLAHQKIVGHEALIRGNNLQGQSVTPPQIFQRAASQADLVYLDRFCRALHIQNFLLGNDHLNWLFLNVKPDVIVNGRQHGNFFRELIEAMGVAPERIVIEILESPLLDEDQLCASADFYREIGCLVAIDDFGAGHSNFHRIWRIRPHIVKLDQSIIRHANTNMLARRMLPNIVATLHEAGSLVLMEGIENQQEAMVAMHANIDLVQGYFFSRPASALSSDEAIKPLIIDLFDIYRSDLLNSAGIDRYASYIAAMHAAAVDLHDNDGHPATERLVAILNQLGADRYYLLNEEGIQIGPSVSMSRSNHCRNKHFRPLEQGQNASWIRRPYLQRALQRPDQVHITRPYLSVATGRLCVTLSIAYRCGGKVQVLCCDLDHEQIEESWAVDMPDMQAADRVLPQ